MGRRDAFFWRGADNGGRGTILRGHWLRILVSVRAWDSFLLLLVKEVHEVPLISPQIVISLLTIPKIHGFLSLSLERSLCLRASTEVLRSQNTLFWVILWLIMRLRNIWVMQVCVTIILRHLLIVCFANHWLRCTVKLGTGWSILQLSLSLSTLMMNLPEDVHYVTSLGTSISRNRSSTG